MKNQQVISSCCASSRRLVFPEGNWSHTCLGKKLSGFNMSKSRYFPGMKSESVSINTSPEVKAIMLIYNTTFSTPIFIECEVMDNEASYHRQHKTKQVFYTYFRMLLWLRWWDMIQKHLMQLLGSVVWWFHGKQLIAGWKRSLRFGSAHAPGSTRGTSANLLTWVHLLLIVIVNLILSLISQVKVGVC